MPNERHYNELNLESVGINLPYNMQAEQSVLGAVLLKPETLTDLVEIIRPEMFYTRQNAQIYSEMLRLFTSDQTIDFVSYEKQITDSYNSVRVFRNATLMAAVTMFFVMLMGLIGYTADEVRRRGKEIAIRKVNGAEASSILELLSKDVLVVALPAVVLGTLASWYINGIWMEQFAEQVPLGWVVYLLVVIANLAVIVGCVLWKSWRIANENPVNSIKSE